MSIETQIALRKLDHLRLTQIIKDCHDGDLENLEKELERAQIVDDASVPEDLITMNSRLIYQDLTNGEEKIITIVYPAHTSLSEGKISVLAPLGASLIGLRVGQTIDWSFPNGKTKTLLVKKLLYQPEANGVWDL